MALKRVLTVGIAFGIAGSIGLLAFTITKLRPAEKLLATGKLIEPIGSHVDVGSYPVNMVLSPDGKFVIVTNSGFREQLSVIDAASGSLVDKVEFGSGRGSKAGLYYGIAFGADGTLYASRGAEDKVSTFTLSAAGKLTAGLVLDDKAPEGSALPHHVAGVAELNGNVLAVNNQTHKGSGMKGSLSVIDAKSNTIKQKIVLPGFPFGIAIAGGKAYVTSERDGVVAAVDVATGTVKEIRTGENSTGIVANRVGTRLYVSNSNSDTLSIIDAKSDKVVKTILLRPAELRGLPGCTPFGLCLSTDEKTAFVAMSDLNAVAVVDLEKGAIRGYLPAGWYPTSTAVTNGGKYLYVASAKGVKAQNPNGKAVGSLGQYIQNVIEGTVTRIELEPALKDLGRLTEVVLRTNRADKGTIERLEKSFVKPPIEHVIYIVKENRTYDQVLGDLAKGNGDPSLCLFPREITPNLHALAERFVQLDNFHVCAEVSADGWNWSTSGMANEYTSRNSVYNYSGRGRNYDFEGTNNGVVPEREGLRDVAEAAGGYIWDQAAKQKVSFRNYGMYLTFDSDSDDKRETRFAPDNAPAKKVLIDSTEPDFRRYDMAYADSEAWKKHGLTAAPKQMAEFGTKKDPARLTAWLRDYDRLLKEGKMPKMMLVRLGRDHTSGTSAGTYAPEAMVADNDYAVAQLVEKVSNGPLWTKTAIFIVEDDAQAGFDHVDAHRSIAFVISPYTKRSSLDSRFYNTDSVLRTMSLLIGLKPWNQYIATAIPMNVFGTKPENSEPYHAILPKVEIVGKVNKATDYRSADSDRLMNRFEEESLPDMELNDILWGSIKGKKTPRPKTPGAKWHTPLR
jgi:YVTN family beta-propeller protein